MRNEWIWFDMDGTIADLYAVDGWLDDLIAFRTRPYEVAEMLYNQIDLILMLETLKQKGYKIGVISWSSKANDENFDKAVALAKRDWLRRKCLEGFLDEIIVTAYGVRKADTCRKYGKGILVDDEKPNRDEWDLGKTIDATKNILDELAKM